MTLPCSPRFYLIWLFISGHVMMFLGLNEPLFGARIEHTDSGRLHERTRINVKKRRERPFRLKSCRCGQGRIQDPEGCLSSEEFASGCTRSSTWSKSWVEPCREHLDRMSVRIAHPDVLTLIHWFEDFDHTCRGQRGVPVK